MYPFERFTEEAKKVLTLAQQEAERSRHSYIGTEHLLLGILRGDGPGAEALGSLKIQIDDVRRGIVTVLGGNERAVMQQAIPTSRVKKVIEISFEEARRLGHEFVDSGHMLVALMLEGEGIAAHVLQDMGATKPAVTTAVKASRRATPRPGPVIAPRDMTGADTESLLGLLQTPHIARLLESRGMDVDALEELLSHPPETVVRLRRYVADLRSEIETMVARRDFEKAANLQKGEKDLLGRLRAAETEWIDGLQRR